MISYCNLVSRPSLAAADYRQMAQQVRAESHRFQGRHRCWGLEFLKKLGAALHAYPVSARFVHTEAEFQYPSRMQGPPLQTVTDFRSEPDLCFQPFAFQVVNGLQT